MRQEARAARGSRAVFLDRDGTLVYPRHYPSRPEELILYSGIAAELRALQRVGFRLVVVTNQSGIARGLFTEETLREMHGHLAVELGREGVRIDAWYHCPHHPDGLIAELAVRCECRKPEAGMLLRAAHELDLALDRSWMVGDILGDIEAGRRAGCRTVLVDLGTESSPDTPERAPDYVARDTLHALRLIVALDSGAGATAPPDPVDLTYRPARWMSEAASVRPHGRPVALLDVDGDALTDARHADGRGQKSAARRAQRGGTDAERG